MTDIRPFVPAILFEGKKRGTSESSDTATATSDGGGGGGAEGSDKTQSDAEQAKPEEEGIYTRNTQKNAI